MRVLIVGGGGREHALAWKFKLDDPSLTLFAAPGNPGLAELGTCVPLSPLGIDELRQFAQENEIDLTVVGPEAPLAAGIVDAFSADGLAIFGPTAAAAEIETSKAFAKQLMLDEGIPTARAEMHTSPDAAKAAVRRFGAPVVVKASGLASGKGVIVCATLEEAESAVDDMLSGNRFGSAGHEVLIEEFMEGEELSVFAIADGTAFVMLPGLQDHKRLLDGDHGPNTGGMGAYLPVSLDVDSGAVARIFTDTLAGMRKRGRPFKGLLYCGLMITRDGPKVIEFNCRFGDPETQALMPVLELAPSLLELMSIVARGDRLPEVHASISGACVTTVLAARGYPETPDTGDVIHISPVDALVFHAGTARSESGDLLTAGGRVMSVSSTAATVDEARRRSSDAASCIAFNGKQNRNDIGWREVARAPRD